MKMVWSELYKVSISREAGGKGAFLPKRQSDTFLRLSGSDRLPMYSLASHTAAG